MLLERSTGSIDHPLQRYQHGDEGIYDLGDLLGDAHAARP
jgi:hypothetical protein